MMHATVMGMVCNTTIWLLAVNSAGTINTKPLVTGKTQKPQYFAGVKFFHRLHCKQKIMDDFFSEWLNDLDNRMKKKTTNISIYLSTTALPMGIYPN